MDHRIDDPGKRRLSGFGQLALVWIITFVFIVTAALIIALPFSTGDSVGNLTVGVSAPQDILAPRPITFLSQVLTEQARAQAAAAAPDIYDPPDARVARQAVLLLRDILDFVNTVRADALASPAQKQADLLSLRDLRLTPETADLILSFSDAQWTAVQAEALSVLEQVMRSEVRPGRLEDVRRSVPARVSVNLSDPQAQVVSLLVAGLITPNSLYNEAATVAAREAARQNVEPVYRQVVLGEAILVRGRVVTEADLETLQALGLLQTERRWQENASVSVAVVITGALLALYVGRFNPEMSRSPKHVLLLGLLFNIFLLGAKLMVPGHTLLPFLFPAAALSMLLTVIAGPNLAITATVALAALTGYIGGNWLELTIYTAIGGLIAALTLGRAERVNQFFWAGLAGALANASIILVFRLSDPTTDTLGLAQLLAISILNGGVSASLTLAGFFILGGLFDITTSLQLIELARPDHPLLQFILRNAPGTYQHSLQVANLAEQAAERIGANAMLIRVGALYHDCGKALKPQYFVENQLDGLNIHDQLDPTASAEIIVGHIHDGIQMARRHRLPARIRAFIPEHHGTLKTMYQYKRALKAAGDDASKVDESKFVYPGPRPQSKETALLMLADGCEAKARSDRPQTEEDIDRIVKSVIDDRMARGQLDDTGLTLRDLQLTRESFVTTLKGIFHPRLQYPEEKPPASSQ
ncbi:MAG TPA: HDIG domain-containing protein [Anaerolineales bacterium]|nr:HDIG domain-containing protein [Anaerolineales bacterium]